jgi:N-acetylglutamate synthase-like GNAT family acetyltransferase
VEAPEPVVRRANVDDLPGLKQLWERARFQVLDIEKHLTEFQVATTPDGDLLGSMALRIQGKHGHLHHEAFIQPERADDARPWLWQRFQILARNHGLVRLWTLESSPFWHQSGFAEADADLLKKLPAEFGDPHARWYTLALREESAQAISLEKEFELFQQTQRASTEQVFAHARRIKTLAYVLTAIVGLIVAVGLFFVFLRTTRSASPAPSQQPPTAAPASTN